MYRLCGGRIAGNGAVGFGVVERVGSGSGTWAGLEVGMRDADGRSCVRFDFDGVGSQPRRGLWQLRSPPFQNTFSKRKERRRSEGGAGVEQRPNSLEKQSPFSQYPRPRDTVMAVFEVERWPWTVSAVQRRSAESNRRSATARDGQAAARNAASQRRRQRRPLPGWRAQKASL